MRKRFLKFTRGWNKHTFHNRKNKKEQYEVGLKNRFYHSIGFKFMFAFLLPVLSVIGIGILSYQKASDAIILSYRDNGFQSLIMTSDYSSFGLNSSEATAFQYVFDDTFKNYFNGLYKDDVKKEYSIQNTIGKTIITKETSDQFISGIHFLADGKNLISTFGKDTSDYDNLYQEFLVSSGGKGLADNAKAAYWIGEDEFLNQIIGNTDYAIRYVKGFQTAKACIIVDISAKQIRSMLERLDYGEDSIVGFVTEDKKEIILSKDSGFQDGNQLFTLTEFYQEARENTENTSGSQDVQFKGGNYLFLYSVIEGSNAMLCALIPEKNILKHVSDIKNLTIVFVIVSSFIVAAIGIFLTIGLQNVIRYINGELYQVANGKLTSRLKSKRKDEFAVLVDGTNHMIDNMHSLITEIKSQINSITLTSREVKTASGGFLGSSEVIAGSIEEVQIGINEQAADSTNCLLNIDNLSGKIDVVNGKASEISNIADDTIQSIHHGTGAIQILGSKTKSTTEITSKIKQNINILKEKSTKISAITTTINNIAEETNLLSLNASIEAARAGDFGRGFAVVADEIRKLAEQSSGEVKEISQLIEDIQNQTTDTVLVVKEAEHIVSEQETAVTETRKSFQDINHRVDQLIKNVQLIMDNIIEIQTAKVEAMEAIEHISAVSQQTASSSLAITEITSQQLVSAKELGRLSDKLDQNAEGLSSMISHFTLEE